MIGQQNQFVLEPSDIEYLERILLDENGLLKPVPFAAIRSVPQNDISVFCHKHGVYQIVTTELVEFVSEKIAGYKTIEIGSGNGCLGRSLGIPLTDSRIQETGEMKLLYASMKQPRVCYGADVQKIEALQAVKVLKAEAAVGAWVTHKYKHHLGEGCYGGVDEAILSKRLKRYVFVGNEITHRNKELLRFSKPSAYKFDWLVSRSPNRGANVVWIFDFEK